MNRNSENVDLFLLDFLTIFFSYQVRAQIQIGNAVDENAGNPRILSQNPDFLCNSSRRCIKVSKLNPQ